MGASKEMFLQMRAEDLSLMYSEDFTKKKAIEVGKKLVDDIFNKGEVDEKKVFSNIARLKEVINSADKTLRERTNFIGSEIVNGVEFTPKAGSKKYNYDEDPIYNELVKKVKDREDLLKTAKGATETIFDSEGIEVPKVSISFDKPSVTIKF